MPIDSPVAHRGGVYTAVQQKLGQPGPSQSGIELHSPSTSRFQSSTMQIDSPVAHLREGWPGHTGQGLSGSILPPPSTSQGQGSCMELGSPVAHVNTARHHELEKTDQSGHRSEWA